MIIILILFLILLSTIIIKSYFGKNINIFLNLINFEINNFYFYLIMILLLWLVIKLLYFYYIKKISKVRNEILITKRNKFFETNVYNSNKLTATNNNKFKLKTLFKSYFSKNLKKNFFCNERNLFKKFLFLKILSNAVISNQLNINKKNVSFLNAIVKFDFREFKFNQSILNFFNNDFDLIKKRKKNYYTLLLVHFLILKLQRKELINSLNLSKRIGNYPFTLAYDEEVINFRRSKYFDYTSTELFFLLLYGILEWLLVFYLIHLGLCIFYNVNVFEIFFKIFENFLPYHFRAYSDYLKISLLLNTFFFFFMLIYTLTDWVFELTDEVSTYQLPPKDWFVDIFLPTLQGILLVLITFIVFFLFIYNGYVFIMILLYNPFEYFYNFVLGSIINLENLVILLTLFDIKTFLNLYFLDCPGLIFNFYSPFFQKTGIFYKTFYDENFLWNYSNIFELYTKNGLKNKFYFFSIEYQNLLELKILKNELLIDLRKYNYFLQQESDLLITKDYVNKGFRGLGLRLDNQYFFKNIDFVNKNNLRHFRPNSESIIDPILTTKYQQSYKFNDLNFTNLSIMPDEKKLMNVDFFDFNVFNDNYFNFISNKNYYLEKNFQIFFNKIFNFFSTDNFLFHNYQYLYPLDINEFLNYKINSKFLYNDLIFENIFYFNDENISTKLNKVGLDIDFLPIVFPEDQRDLLLLNLKLLNLNVNDFNTLNDLKNYIGKILILGDFLNNEILIKNKYLTKKQIDQLCLDYNYSPESYFFLKNLLHDEKNFKSLVLFNVEFLQKKQIYYTNDVYKDEIEFLLRLLKKQPQNANQNLNFSKIIIKNDFIYPFLNIFLKPFYYIRTLDSLSVLPRISSSNNSMYFHEDDENIDYWWDNFLIIKRLFKFYANFPSIFSFKNRSNIIYLNNFGEKIYFKNDNFNLLSDNINELKLQNFSSYYNMEIKFQNFAYFQNTVWDRYFHKFYDSTFITKKREVFLIEYNNSLKNKLSFAPFFGSKSRFFQPIFNILWKVSKNFWLEYPEQNYVTPYIQYSKHLLDFPEYYKLEIDFSQVVLDQETNNILEGYRNPIIFSTVKKERNNIVNGVKDINDIEDSGFIIDRDLLRSYQFGDYSGLLLFKDYQATLFFDKKNFFLNNYLYNLYMDKLYFILYSVNISSLKKYFNYDISNLILLNYSENLYYNFKFFSLNFIDFYAKNLNIKNSIDIDKTVFLKYFCFKNTNKKKNYNLDFQLFIPYLDKNNIYFMKYFFNYFNVFTKQEELNGVFQRINTRLNDFIDRLLLEKQQKNSYDFLNNYFNFFNLKNYLKIRSIDPWELYLINKNQNIYDSIIYKHQFLFNDLPYDELLENSRNKLRKLQKLTYVLTPYRLNYRGFRKFGILRHDLKLQNLNIIIAFYLDKKNYVDFEFKIINKKLQKLLFNIIQDKYKNKVHKDLLHELSYELGIGSHLGRKINHKKMDYRLLHFVNSRHFLLKSKTFCNIFYSNKINPYDFNMYNFPFDNEFSKIWSKSFHNQLLSNQFFEKVNADRLFGKEFINNQIRYKRIFFFKIFQILIDLQTKNEINYYNNFKKNFSLIFDVKTNPFFYLENKKIVNLKRFNSVFFNENFYDIDFVNFKMQILNQKKKLNEFDYLLILKDYIPSFLNFFYENINVPYFDWFVSDEWVSKRFRKYGFRLFKTYRTFYFKDEKFPLDYFSRKKLKRLQNFQILEKIQAKRRRLKKKRFIYHDQKLLIYKYIPAVRAKIPKPFRIKSRWVFVINKIKPIPILLIFKNNDIRANKIRSYIFFLQNMGNSMNCKSGSLFWIYFLNNKNKVNFLFKSSTNQYLFNFEKSLSFKDIGKFLIFNKNDFNKLFFFSNISDFKSYLRYNFINNLFFIKNKNLFYRKKFDLYNYNINNLSQKKLNQFKYLSRFLVLNDNNLNVLNFYTPEEYFKYNKSKWNLWLNLNKYRKIEEHYIQYNLSQYKTFPANINDGSDFNIKEIEEYESKDQPYFLSNPAVIVPQVDLSDEIPFRLETPKKYYIPYVHEKWYYNNLIATYPISCKNFKFYSLYQTIYEKIRCQTILVLKKKVQFDFFQIQKIYYSNNLLYKYNYENKVSKLVYFNNFYIFTDKIYFINFLKYLKYQFLYFNRILNVKFLFYISFLKEIPLIGKFLVIFLNFFFSFYLFFYNICIFFLYPFLINFFEIIYSDFIKFFLVIKKLYFHPFWIFILYFLWILYYYILVRVFTNSKEIYDFKNIAAQLDWDEEAYDFDVVRRKFDTKSFFELSRPNNGLFLKNAIEFQERDRTPTINELQKMNIFSYQQNLLNKNQFYKRRIMPYWFTKIYPNYENMKNEPFELNFTRQSNAFVYNYFIKPMYRLYLNTTYVSKTNFIFKNNNVERLALKYYFDSLLKNFSRHGSDTSEFGRFRWFYIASVFFFQFLFIVFISSFIIFLLF